MLLHVADGVLVHVRDGQGPLVEHDGRAHVQVLARVEPRRAVHVVRVLRPLHLHPLHEVARHEPCLNINKYLHKS